MAQESFTQVITGDTDNDRHFFRHLRDLTENDNMPKLYRLDLHKVTSLNLISLGLIAWLHEHARELGCTIEFINCKKDHSDLLKIYGIEPDLFAA